MRDERERDCMETVLKNAPQWEPPTGFALRVTNAARQEPPADPLHQRTRRERLYLAGWWRGAVITAIRGRVESAVWVLWQYVSLLKR